MSGGNAFIRPDAWIGSRFSKNDHDQGVSRASNPYMSQTAPKLAMMATQWCTGTGTGKQLPRCKLAFPIFAGRCQGARHAAGDARRRRVALAQQLACELRGALPGAHQPIPPYPSLAWGPGVWTWISSSYCSVCVLCSIPPCTA